MNLAVFNRELLDRLRTWRTIASILAFAGLACLLVYMRWPTDSRLDVLSQGSMEVFRPLAYGLAVAVMLLVPAFPATALVRERRSGTLTLLLNSMLRPWEIYFGKLASNFLLATVIVSTSLPALAACYAMGGITLSKHVIPLLVVLLSMALQYTAVGLLVSIRASTSDGSLRWTYACVLMLSLLTLAPAAIVGNVDNLQGTIAKWLTVLSPLGALRSITSSVATSSGFEIASGWYSFLGGALISTGICSLITLTLLNPYRSDRAKPTGRLTHERGLAGRWWRRFNYVIDPESRSLGIPLWINPVMVKEFRTRKFGRLHWLIRLVAICAIVSLLLTFVAATGTISWGVDRIAAALVLMQVALLVMLGPSLAAGLIAGERESGGWQLLRLAPMSPLRIVFGKLMSVLWTMALILLATLPGYAVMMWIQPALAPQVSRVIISLLICTIMIVTLSAMISTFWRNSAAATATSYGVLLLLFLGTLLVWLAEGKPFGRQFVEKVLMFNPAAAALCEIQAPGFDGYSLLPMGWWIGCGVSLAALALLSFRTWQLTRPD